MGKGQSKEIENEEISVVGPVNAPRLASDNYEVHEVHSGTIKATCIILLFTVMSICICAFAIKRFCKHVKVMTHAEANPNSAVAKKHFPDI